MVADFEEKNMAIQCSLTYLFVASIVFAAVR